VPFQTKTYTNRAKPWKTPSKNFEEEIEAIIDEELGRHHQENECLWLVQEQMIRRRAVIVTEPPQK
jgi:hypothetical protein